VTDDGLPTIEFQSLICWKSDSDPKNIRLQATAEGAVSILDLLEVGFRRNSAVAEKRLNVKSFNP